MHPNNTANAVSSNKGLNISEHMPPSTVSKGLSVVKITVHTSSGPHEVNQNEQKPFASRSMHGKGVQA